MISQITGACSADHINIHEMVNKSKGDYSYTMLDLDSKVTDAVVKHLEGIEGVIKVRVIK